MKFKKHWRSLLCFLLMSVLSLSLFTGCAKEDVELATDILTAVLETELEDESEVIEETTGEEFTESLPEEEITEEPTLSEDGTYTSKDEVAEYLYLYGHLPSNFITKKEAKKLGWVSSEGNLDEVAPGMSIGGDYFGNYEGLLPMKKGRTYTECDIDTRGAKSRGAKRIVFSNDGLVYYTDDHYETFTLLYGEE